MLHATSTENIPYEVRFELHSAEFLPLTSWEHFGWLCEAWFQNTCVALGETQAVFCDEAVLLFKLVNRL